MTFAGVVFQFYLNTFDDENSIFFLKNMKTIKEMLFFLSKYVLKMKIYVIFNNLCI